MFGQILWAEELPDSLKLDILECLEGSRILNRMWHFLENRLKEIAQLRTNTLSAGLGADEQVEAVEVEDDLIEAAEALDSAWFGQGVLISVAADPFQGQYNRRPTFPKRRTPGIHEDAGRLVWFGDLGMV